jgi:hypothetical protein
VRSIVAGMTTTTTLTAAPSDRPLLRLALLVDAVVTGANGAAYLALGSVLDSPLGISSSVLHPVGAFLLLFAIGVWTVASRPTTAGVALVVAANAVWALDSIAVVAFDWGTPTTLGAVWIALQALVVGAFAAAQAFAARA